MKLFFSKTKLAEMEPRFWLTSSSTGRFTSLMTLSCTSFLRSSRQAAVLSFEGLLHSMIHASHSSFKPDVRKTLLFYFVFFMVYRHKIENENSELCRLLIPCPKPETKALLIPKSNINWERGRRKIQTETTLWSDMFSSSKRTKRQIQTFKHMILP